MNTSFEIVNANSRIIGIVHNLNETGKDYSQIELVIRYLKDQTIVAKLKKIDKVDISSKNLVENQTASLHNIKSILMLAFFMIMIATTVA